MIDCDNKAFLRCELKRVDALEAVYDVLIKEG